jgi:hypothetical protein
MLIHKNMSEKAFTRDKTLMTRDEWRTWLEWAGSIHQEPRRNERPAPGPAAATARTSAAPSGRHEVSSDAGHDATIPKSS